MPDEAGKKGLIGAHPWFERFTAAELDVLWGAGVERDDLARWDPDPAARRDAIVRHAIGLYLRDAYALGPEQAWAFEGIGLYLSRLLTGTRASIFLSGKEADDADVAGKVADFADGERNWMSDAHALLGAEPAPDLVSLLAKPLADLTVDDRVIAYALAAFCIEAKPRETPALLRSLAAVARGRGTTEEAIGKNLGLDPASLRRLVVQWLEERR